MIAFDSAPMSRVRRTLVRVVAALALFLSASAAIIVFLVMPFAALQHWHMLPNWDIFLIIYVLFPLVIVWNHAGFYIVLTVAFCELIIVQLAPPVRRTTIEAFVKIAVCVVAYLLLYVGNRFNFH